MSNCNNLFIKFNGELSIPSTKKAKLIKSRDNLRDMIRKHIADKHSEYTPKFRGQGSYDLGTMIRTKDDTCDLDNGVYFFPKPKETGTTIQGWIWDAVEDATGEKPQHRKKCIRVIYKGDYHIDLPVYYKDDEKSLIDKPYLAVKDEEWQKSDPKEFKDWFIKVKDDKGQLVRIVKYLKAWCDNRAKKMPTGLAMTILASNNIKYNDNDDKALRDTLKEIKKVLKTSWSCVMPTTPYDDLFGAYAGDKDYFFEAIDTFIEDADNALEVEKNQLKASKLWRKHLGSYFPEGEDADVDRKLALATAATSNLLDNTATINKTPTKIESALEATAASILAGKAKTNNLGVIQEKTGVSHLPHKNYGGENVSE